MLNFHTNWKAHKENGKDYTFKAFCGLFITNQHKILEEGRIGDKNQSHLLKVKGKLDPMDRVQFDASTQKPTCNEQEPKGHIDATQQS